MVVDHSGILASLNSLHVDTRHLADEEVDATVIGFYESRLVMCIQDNCLEAANAYLRKLHEDQTINASTKLEVLRLYNKLTLKEE